MFQIGFFKRKRAVSPIQRRPSYFLGVVLLAPPRVLELKYVQMWVSIGTSGELKHCPLSYSCTRDPGCKEPTCLVWVTLSAVQCSLETHCKLSLQNIKNTFLILICTHFLPSEQPQLVEEWTLQGVEMVLQGYWPILIVSRLKNPSLTCLFLFIYTD